MRSRRRWTSTRRGGWREAQQELGWLAAGRPAASLTILCSTLRHHEQSEDFWRGRGSRMVEAGVRKAREGGNRGQEGALAGRARSMGTAVYLCCRRCLPRCNGGGSLLFHVQQTPHMDTIYVIPMEGQFR